MVASTCPLWLITSWSCNSSSSKAWECAAANKVKVQLEEEEQQIQQQEEKVEEEKQEEQEEQYIQQQKMEKKEGGGEEHSLQQQEVEEILQTQYNQLWLNNSKHQQ
jgi:hypothetical protein